MLGSPLVFSENLSPLIIEVLVMPEPAVFPPLPQLGELVGDLVLVRRFREADAGDLFTAVTASRAELLPWLPWAASYRTLGDAVAFVQQMEMTQALDYTCGVWERATGRLVGGIGLHPRDPRVPSFEIGYWLHTAMTGKGFMTESVRLIATFALERLGANRVYIRCDARNERSAATARRSGFIYEGTFRHDEVVNDGSLRDTMYFSHLPGDGPLR